MRIEQWRCRRFTLIELLIAIAILGLALTSTLAIIAESQNDLISARDEWMAQHALAQATEYALLVNPQNLSIPDGILPDGYRADVTLSPLAEQLPEYAATPQSGWMLGSYLITVYGPNGDQVAQQSVYKIVREVDL